jgi:hypothetical protein
MALLTPEIERLDDPSYQLFLRAQQQQPWSARDLIGTGRTELDDDRVELAWHVASQGYYAEQAGLVAAAELAAQTEDFAFRLGLASAVADEARHSDAFLAYAVARGGQPAPCQEKLDELHGFLSAASYLEKCLVHTMLEGFAADEFIVLAGVFGGDPLGAIYRSVRVDEVRHVALGLNYLRRSVAGDQVREQWRTHFDEWERGGLQIAGMSSVSSWVASLTGRRAEQVEAWFLRRHRARIAGAGLPVPAVPLSAGSDAPEGR